MTRLRAVSPEDRGHRGVSNQLDEARDRADTRRARAAVAAHEDRLDPGVPRSVHVLLDAVPDVHRVAGACADQVASLHERGVDLGIDAARTAELPAPGGAAPAWRVHEPGVKPSRWKSLVDMVSGSRPHRREWDEEK